MATMNYKHLYYFWVVAKAGGILRAGEQLNTTPQTLSGQIKLLEARMGKPLFRKQGRSLVLTETGKLALSYADEIFSLGAELEDLLRGELPNQDALEFRVGVADAVPKSIAYRLLEPALQIPEPVKLVCREWKLDSLLAELALHRLDLVIADAPIPSGVSVKAFNHRLGQSGTSFFAAPPLAARCQGAFPALLDGMPMLVFGEQAAQGGRVSRWLRAHKVFPRVVGEFDDGALMKAFGRQGRGVFTGPTVMEQEIEAQFGVQVIGRTTEVVEEFYAISIERRITHPCVAAITQSARDLLGVEG
jgi:LysR family transcriptional activator of nhaA